MRRRVGTAAARRGGDWLATARAALRALPGAMRVIAGAPDYARYVEHMRARHPGEPVLPRAEFLRQRLSARYDRPGSKCC